jgi:NADH-quinone oxidoreductase subunit L
MALDLVWLLPAFPLAGFVVNLLFGRRLGEPLSGVVATAATAASFATAVSLFFVMLGRDAEERIHEYVLFRWLDVGGLHVDMGFLLDPLSITMALFVTGIGALIHLYAIGYMHGDPKFSKFFLYLNLFVFSMLMLVLGDNMLVTFLGWEGVGVCSYFLISFWQTRESAATAGKKAFVTNRIGDWGFMVAMFFTWQAVGSLNYVTANEVALGGGFSNTLATGISLMLLVGAAGKSAQLPLFVWLPDAMEGPTPVSALIHAATMVTAGVYLLARTSPILEAGDAGTIIAIVGVATALFAATAAVSQNDIKKVLAYSTVSQLGYMFLAVGSGAYVAALFHMITHAFFKALLFLGSGSVIHGMHDEQDMRWMGALRKAMPITAITFIIGWLAIAGVPPFAGFWSKDEILLYAYGKSPILWALGLVAALLTAYYMTRQVIMVFFGEARWNEARPGHDDKREVHPHESPWTMTLPLVVLSGLAIVGGAMQLPFSKDLHFLEKWLAPVLEEVEASTPSVSKLALALAATAMAFVGIALAFLVYGRKRLPAIEPPILAKAWGLDAAYAAFMGGPGRKLFDFITWFVDRKVIDGAVNGVGAGFRAGGGVVRKVQTGYVRNYALYVAIGVVGLLTWFVVRGAV